MSDASFASLGPTLLARKGGAKPAMRPQVAPLPGVVTVEAEQLEDLGWNDMGETDDVPANDTLANDTLGTDSPVVLHQQHRLAERVAKGATAKGSSAKASAKRTKKATKSAKSAPKNSARRAAFTLRLDPDRHLKLRLAATMHGTSAQALVTKALDAMLEEIEDLDALADRMKRN